MFDQRGYVALLVAGALFIEILDSTIITIVLPMIAADFGVPATQLSIGVSAYMVAVTLFIPLSGYVADRFGAKSTFMCAVAIFTASSILCGMSNNLIEFTVSRAMQGIGGAMMVPVGRLAVLRDCPKSDLVKMVAIFTWPALTAPLIGPILGAWIATQFSWPWIFFINLPIGLLALVAALFLLDNTQYDVGKFDSKGFVLCGTGFCIFMLALEFVSTQADNPSFMALGLLPIAISGFVILLAIKHLKKARYPLFRFESLSVNTFRFAATGGSLARIAIGSAPFLIPLMLQLCMGYSALQAGALLVWLFIGNISIKPATTWIMKSFGFKRVLNVNSLLLGGTFILIALFQTNTSKEWIAIVLFLSGAARSMQLTLLNTIAFCDIASEKVRDANTLGAIITQMNRGMAISLSAVILAIASLIAGTANVELGLFEFICAFGFMAVLSLICCLISLNLAKDDGHAVLTSSKN